MRPHRSKGSLSIWLIISHPARWPQLKANLPKGLKDSSIDVNATIVCYWTPVAYRSQTAPQPVFLCCISSIMCPTNGLKPQDTPSDVVHNQVLQRALNCTTTSDFLLREACSSGHHTSAGFIGHHFLPVHSIGRPSSQGHVYSAS